MTLPVALGVNLWVVAVALPMLLAAHARALAGVSTAGWWATSLSPLVALGLGARVRGVEAQAWALLVAFPGAGGGARGAGGAGGGGAGGAGGGVDTGGGVAGRVPRQRRARAGAGRARASAARRHGGDDAAAASGSGALALAAAAARVSRIGRRWRSASRSCSSAWSALSPSFAASLDAAFGANAARAQALAVVGVGLLWTVLLRAYVLAPLTGHLQHDRDLLRAMERDRRHARRGRPRAGFYVAVGVALAAMVAVVWQRARP